MLLKTKEIKNNHLVYINKITGQTGTLNEHVFIPSQRRHKRHMSPLIAKVHTNRKSTKGRNTYFQIVNEYIEIAGKIVAVPTGKVIKHIQESYDAIQRKIAVLNFYDRIELNKAKWYKQHPEYKAKRV